jgi:iron complex transport system substrate-binding protein|tara:strand:+ start:20460 stop:21548 length:1089 start_codon:yes stop_codon:yes gene_type:complete
MRKIAVGFLVMMFLFSCKEEKANSNSEGKKNIIEYASNLRIFEGDESTKIEILSPETGKTEQTWWISKEDSDKENHIKSPCSKMVTLSSTHVGMLSKLNSISSIVGVTNELYVFNPELLKNIRTKKVIEVGEEGQIPVETILKSGCKLIIYSGFGKEFPHSEQLKKVGINSLVNYDWREIHPLGKAEWILLFGYLTGKEKEAKDYFQKVKQEYLELKNTATSFKTKPSVLSGNLVVDTWFAPAGKSFNAELISDAHTNYVYANTDGTGSLALSMEKILTDNSKTEFWINPGMPTKEKLFGFQEKLRLLGPVDKNPIYDYSKSGNRFWEMSAIEPQKVLSDYIQIFHSSEVAKKSLYFYREVK